MADTAGLSLVLPNRSRQESPVAGVAPETIPAPRPPRGRGDHPSKMNRVMYKLDDCIRLGLLIGASFGAVTEALIALQGDGGTAVSLLIRSALGIAHAGVLT